MKLMQIKKRVFIIGTVILLVIALPITVYLAQQQQNLRQGATAAKTLPLIPANQQAQVGSDVTFNLVLHPSGVKVKYIKAVLTYDPTKFTAGVFTKDPGFNFDIVTP